MHSNQHMHPPKDPTLIDHLGDLYMYQHSYGRHFVPMYLNKVKHFWNRKQGLIGGLWAWACAGLRCEHMCNSTLRESTSANQCCCPPHAHTQTHKVTLVSWFLWDYWHHREIGSKTEKYTAFETPLSCLWVWLSVMVKWGQSIPINVTLGDS